MKDCVKRDIIKAVNGELSGKCLRAESWSLVLEY